ncbi:NIF family HAD-type phosphatase [Candidatus Uabimicrobium sp. HlEnr_7]|uniref:NIF family HAD-type phosphatase n=1 Tax=Candidatus Uabimicrobium helgolandensis TaxID=3095367 RepID=UPI0035568DB0
MKKRIAFDLDETLGTAISDGYNIVGFNIRQGCLELLNFISSQHELVLWTVSNRSYLNKVLNYHNLANYFSETYAWEDVKEKWKDVRRFHLDLLIDDSNYHKQQAKQYAIEHRYIIIPEYGSPQDNSDSLLWTKLVRQAIKHISK